MNLKITWWTALKKIISEWHSCVILKRMDLPEPRYKVLSFKEYCKTWGPN